MVFYERAAPSGARMHANYFSGRECTRLVRRKLSTDKSLVVSAILSSSLHYIDGVA